MNLFAFDLETTDKVPALARPVQICIVQKTDQFSRVIMNTLVNPLEEISEEASSVHGIRKEHVTGAPDYAMVAWQAALMYEQIGPTYLVGFNSIHFDEPIIDRCLGSPVFPQAKHIDVLNALYRYFPTLQSHKLGDAHLSLVGTELTGAHDASVDVFGTIAVLERICAKASMTVDQLYEDLKVAKPYTILPIGKHKGKMLEDIPYSWANWMFNNANDMRPDLQATVDHILRNGLNPRV